jgi:GGDEF domain-containing protein
MVVRGFEESSHAHRRAADILRTIETGWCRAGHEQALACAIGIGLFPEDGDTAESLLTRADEALCDLLALGHNASSFSLRRTVRPRM